MWVLIVVTPVIIVSISGHYKIVFTRYGYPSFLCHHGGTNLRPFATAWAIVVGAIGLASLFFPSFRIIVSAVLMHRCLGYGITVFAHASGVCMLAWTLSLPWAILHMVQKGSQLQSDA